MNYSLHGSRAMPLLLLPAMLLGDAAVTAEDPTLISNGSFESAGVPSLAGWQPGNPDLASVVSPGAPGGGDWALRLEADWAPTLGFVTQRLEGLHDGDIVELRAEVKASGQDGGGMILLFIGDSPRGAPAKWAASSLESWTTLSLVDTVELADGDSVWVQLSSLHTEIVPRVGLFDSVSLTVLGAVPVAPVTWGGLKVRYQ